MLDVFLTQSAVVQALYVLAVLAIFYSLHRAVQITIIVAVTVVWVVLHLFG